MRNPEYCIYGAAKVDNEGSLDSGEDRFNQVREAAAMLYPVVGRQPHNRSRAGLACGRECFVRFSSAATTLLF